MLSSNQEQHSSHAKPASHSESLFGFFILGTNMTEQKLAANRRNAQLSTGPRTGQGKAAVSLNALTHGLRSRHVVLPHEDPAEFQQLCDNLTAEWRPETPTQGHLVTQIAIAIWKLDRLETLEHSGGLEMAVSQSNLSTRIWQQQTRLERSRSKAIAELQRLRQAHQSVPAEPVAETGPAAKASEPAPAPTPEPKPKPAQPEYVMQAVSAVSEAALAVTSPPIAS